MNHLFIEKNKIKIQWKLCRIVSYFKKISFQSSYLRTSANKNPTQIVEKDRMSHATANLHYITETRKNFNLNGSKRSGDTKSKYDQTP